MKPREDRSALSGRSSFHFFERSTRPRSGTRTRARRGGDAEPPARSRPPARGFAVLVQDTRGRFGSDGTFVPVATELEDGAATLAWLARQPWFDGRLAVFGVSYLGFAARACAGVGDEAEAPSLSQVSYLGFTAWACAGGAERARVRAVVSVVSQSRVRSAVFLPGGAFALCLLYTSPSPRDRG